MKGLGIPAFFLCMSLVGFASASPSQQGASAPPQRCEIRFSAWCIVQGASVVTRRLADDGINDRTWSLEGSFLPESKLLILEPRGCKTGHADEMRLISFEKGIEWNRQTLDRAVVRIKSDRSCDLKVLFPGLTGDAREWAFSTGLALIWGCADDACTPRPLADIKPLLVEQGVRNRTGVPLWPTRP